MEDTQFIAQMAQFTSLEQMTNMSSGFTRLTSLLTGSKPLSAVGRNVDIEIDDSKVSGQITAATRGDYPQVRLTVPGTTGLQSRPYMHKTGYFIMMRSLYSGVSECKTTRPEWMFWKQYRQRQYNRLQAGPRQFPGSAFSADVRAARPTDELGGVSEVGLGMNVASIDTIHTQGSLQTTGIQTDIAIRTAFRHEIGEKTYFTRAGTFGVDSEEPRQSRQRNEGSGLAGSGRRRAVHSEHFSPTGPLHPGWTKISAARLQASTTRAI